MQISQEEGWEGGKADRASYKRKGHRAPGKCTVLCEVLTKFEAHSMKPHALSAF